MNWLAALFIGILIGWLIEWIIDWLYWRRRGDDCQEELREARAKIAELRKQLIDSGVVKKDKLQDIHGIGPVIEGKLNDAGIYTFEALSELNAIRLEEIVGPEIRNLADEDSFIKQAKKMAKNKK